MNSFEFGMTCKPFNIAYRELFNEIPVYDNYACTQEEYLEALEKAIADEVRIDKLLIKRSIPDDPNILY